MFTLFVRFFSWIARLRYESSYEYIDPKKYRGVKYEHER